MGRVEAESTSATLVEVALPVPVDELFDYTLPEACDAIARTGCRAVVPFGSRRLTGVIVARRTAEPDSATKRRLRAIERVVDPEPVLSPSLLAVLRELAEEVLCPVGLAIASALPPGSAPRPVDRFRLTARGREALARGALPGPARTLCQTLDDRPASRALLRRRQPRSAALLRDLLRDGVVESFADLDPPSAREATVRVAELAAGVDVEAVIASTLGRAPKQATVLRALAELGPSSLPSLGRRFRRAHDAVRALEERGLVCVHERRESREVLGTPLETPSEVQVTPAQARALGPILAAVHARRPETFLLHGVTGSGKTEVYLRAIAAAREAGRQALILVPEITLTHQILARLRARFGDNLAVLHSGFSPGQRLEQWLRLQRGTTPIAVGARSALFAPLDDLGLIVIDEEHDGAYKNEEGFRYHARDLARLRARAAGCPLVLGSATPALETRLAAAQGTYQRLILPHRIGGRPLPAIEIVDLERERAVTPRGRKLILSRSLQRGLTETLSEGGQAILLHNRRGFSTKVFCFDCGFAEHCKHCDIALVYHAPDQRMRCHYCGFETPPPELCSNCGAGDSALLGTGTQRVEEELRARFPDARTARLDRDTAARKGTTERILCGLRDREIDILVGTQMVAKGHDFPGVRLVGVVLADLGLHMPDFRAAERTFQLLMQVAGRAGRGGVPGRVIVQTFVPDHYALRPLRAHDYESFYTEELEHRRQLAYPPFSRLVHVLVSGPEAAATRSAAEDLARRAAESPSRGAGIEVLGPAPAPLARLRDRYRVQLLVKGTEPAKLHAVARILVAAAARLPTPIRASVDLNPMNML